MRMGNPPTPNPVEWFVFLLSLIGAFTVINWIIESAPESLKAAVNGFAEWMTTAQATPMDVIGFFFVVLIILVVLAYPAVMRV